MQSHSQRTADTPITEADIAAAGRQWQVLWAPPTTDRAQAAAWARTFASVVNRDQTVRRYWDEAVLIVMSRSRFFPLPCDVIAAAAEAEAEAEQPHGFPEDSAMGKARKEDARRAALTPEQRAAEDAERRKVLEQAISDGKKLLKAIKRDREG